MRTNTITVTVLPDATQAIEDASAARFECDLVQYLKIEGIDLPDSYQVDFANVGDDETITMVGGADGVIIPDQLIRTGLPIVAYLYLQTGADSWNTMVQISIPVTSRPERSDIQPTPAEQSTIDSLISALNTGVTETLEAAEEATEAADLLRSASATATTLEPGSEATASYSGGAFTFGIPKGEKGDRGAPGTGSGGLVVIFEKATGATEITADSTVREIYAAALDGIPVTGKYKSDQFELFSVNSTSAQFRRVAQVTSANVSQYILTMSGADSNKASDLTVTYSASQVLKVTFNLSTGRASSTLDQIRQAATDGKIVFAVSEGTTFFLAYDDGGDNVEFRSLPEMVAGSPRYARWKYTSGNLYWTKSWVSLAVTE